jgi:ABC-2 type transport system permease protein
MVSKQKKKDLKSLALAILAIVLINILSTQFFGRLDFTAEKRYTISDISKNILRNLKEPVIITVYLEGDFPSGFKRLRNASKDLMADFKAYAGSNIEYHFVDPAIGKNEQQKQYFFNELYAKGIEATNLSVKTESGLTQKVIIPAAIVSFNGKEIPVKLLQSRMGLNPEEVLNNSVQNLEFAFASAIKKVTTGGKPRIAFTTGHQELNNLQLQDAVKGLSDGYEVVRLDLNATPFAEIEKLKLIIIAKPNTEFTEAEKFKLDQYLMRGGKIIWAIDQVNADLDSIKSGRGQQLAFGKKLNLDDQLFKYGIRINYDLIGDMNCGQIPVSVGNVGSNAQIQMVPWLFNPILMPTMQHPIIKNLDGIRTQFISTIDTIGTKSVQKTILLSTSPYNRELQTPTMISLDMIEDTPDPKRFQSAPKAVCVLLEGNFASDFFNRQIPAGVNESINILPKSKNTKMLIFSDGDVFRSDISDKDGSVYPLGYDRFMQQTFGNRNFLLNAVDYLSDDSQLINLRTKEIELRLLDKGRLVSEKTKFQLINTVVPLLMVIIFAIFQHIYRRRKFAV